MGEKKVIHATSQLCDGSLGTSLNFHTDTVRQNLRRFLERCLLDLIIETELIVTSQIVFGTRVAIVDKQSAGKIIPECDGLITMTAGLPLLVRTHDCIPVFLYGKKTPFVGCLHAGRKNILDGILPKTIELAHSELGVTPEDIFIVVGPHIKSCCYEIQHDVVEELDGNYPECIVSGQEENERKLFLDLARIITVQALSANVPCQNITVQNECTYHSTGDGNLPKYFSWRRDRITNRSIGSVIVLYEET